MPPLHTKETGGGHESPITAFILSPLLPPGEHVMDAASEHPCLQPQRFSAKAYGGGGEPFLSLLTCFPYALAFLFIFLIYCLFPCVKGDLPLTFWANLLATDYFPLNTNCVIGGTFFPHPCGHGPPPHLSTLQQNLAGSRW